MIVDTHIHLLNKAGYLEELMQTVADLNIAKIVLFSVQPGTRWATNDEIMESHLKYPDKIIPFYTFQLGVEHPSVVERVHADGFRGLKLINPTLNYNDESFFPVWERCEDLGLITTFHTGIIARYPEQVHYDLDSSRMKVIYLDRVARRFQKMTMFVAHLGNPDHDEACMMCRWHSNMYFDLSGSTLKYRSPQFLAERLWWGGQTIRYTDEFGRGPWEKIIFGTDVSAPEIAETMEDYFRLFDTLGLSQGIRDMIMGNTAAKLLGLL